MATNKAQATEQNGITDEREGKRIKLTSKQMAQLERMVQLTGMSADELIGVSIEMLFENREYLAQKIMENARQKSEALLNGS